MKTFFSLLIFSFTLSANQNEIDSKTLSKAMGHLVGKNIKQSTITLDEKAFIEGLQESFAGKTPPLPEEQCIAMISEAHESGQRELALNNLRNADTFLQKNKQNKQIVELEEGKLQYHIEKQGTGKKVEGYNTPLVRYKGKYLDGSIFGESSEPERICLNETIPGFKKAIEGMKEGEIRTIYIHPSLGYGESGTLPPNSLLTYEVEILKADTSEKEFVLPKDKLISSTDLQKTE